MPLGTAKDIVSKAAMELGLTQSPISTVTGTLDQDVSQMLSLLSAVADEVLLEEPYRYSLGDGYWVTDKNGVPKLDATTDDDIILFDRRLCIDGLKYRTLKAKGIDFGEEMRDFIARMNKLAAQTNSNVIDLDEDAGRSL